MEYKCQLVVMSTQRSGSTLVCDDLEGTGVLGKPSEYYISLLKRWREDEEMSLKDIRSHIASRGGSANGVVAVKVMSSHMPAIDRMYRDAGSKLCGHEMFPCFFSEMRSAHILRVSRRDRVAQAVSRIMAARTQVYHSVEKRGQLKSMLGSHVSTQKERNEAFEYDESEIIDQIFRVAEEEERLDNCLSNHGQFITTIFYEDLIEDRTYLEHIGRALGINAITPRPRRLRKVAGEESDRWIRRFKAAYPQYELGSSTRQSQGNLGQSNKA